MRLLFILALSIVAGCLGSAAGAAPLLTCGDGGAGDKLAASCADKPLVALDAAVNRAFDAKIALTADPLTGMLFRQERTRLRDSVSTATNEDSQIVDSPDALRTALRREQGLLDAIQMPSSEIMAGHWENTYATLEIKAIAGGYHLNIKQVRPETIEVDPDIPAQDKPPSGCMLDIDLKQGPDGWYAGAIGEKKETTARVARQGISLRLVLKNDDPACGHHDVATGTYFLTHTDGIVSVTASALEKPSFDCGGTTVAIETDICSDPDLARQDRALTAAYAAALTRVDAATGTLLKTDQRNWLRQRVSDYTDALCPTSDKLGLPANNFGNAREKLFAVTDGRIEMLKLIEGRRDGFIGDWMSWDSYVRVGKAKSGHLMLAGFATDLYYHSGWCEYKGKVAIRKDLLLADPTDGHNEETDKSGRATPSVWSDGRTLRIDADIDAKMKAAEAKDGSYQATYCERNRNPTARLFPIKQTVKRPFGEDVSSIDIEDDQ